ncbi:UPF0149 family protein [Photobacterium leiognathi]|uniref:UPF0149 family protein n=1 Tax=Photobacterium leiognathi TaxID=553611 RepID=UPI002982B0D7|nr:UPF0149 family protein [Photobacterium leiognathi]
MSSQLNVILQDQHLAEQLLNESQTRGFVTAMAAAPNIIDPAEWLAFLWGGEEISPFSTHEELEAYANAIIDIWNEARKALFESTWKWPEGCALDDGQIVTQETSDFCEGMLQGWQLARDDWETIMPPESEDNALLGGVLLSISLLFDPETALETLSEQGADALAQFEEIFNAIPTMLCGLTQRGAQLVEA